MGEKDLSDALLLTGKPLRSRDRKKYIENLALRILQYCYDGVYDEFELHDAPDIRNRKGTIGIEVTEAITDVDAQIDGEFVKYRLENNIERKERSKQIIEHRGAKLEDNTLSKLDTDSTIEILTIQNAIKKKMEKLKEYKRKGFQKLELFVYYKDLPIPMKLDHWKNCFDEVLCKYKEKYDIVYFGCSGGLIVYNVLQNDIQVRPIERSVFNRLGYETRLKIEKEKESL